jgi:hypothetical protein
MSHEVYYHFPQADGQARRAGARGGKAAARHRRERLDNIAAEVAEPPACQQDPPFALETTAAAIALLDARYPWLRGTERRSLRSPRSAARA